MPPAKRPQRAPTDDWDQLRLLVTSPAQELYELIRPVVLFGRTPAEHAQETGEPERTLRRQADRFDTRGMASLFEAPAPPAPTDQRALPAAIRQAIVAETARSSRGSPARVTTSLMKSHRLTGSGSLMKYAFPAQADSAARASQACRCARAAFSTYDTET